MEASIEAKLKQFNPVGWGEQGKLRAMTSAKMPYGLSQAVLEAVEAQRAGAG